MLPVPAPLFKCYQFSTSTNTTPLQEIINPVSLPLAAPPQTLCLLRLSAIGDVTHMLPVVRTLQQCWPDTHITWIIGRVESRLVADIEGVEFIVFDKAGGWRAWRQLRQQLAGRRFEVLLNMQVSLRASLLSLLIRSPVKLGYDRARAKDCQWLFCTHRVAAVPRQHVLDGFFEFLKALGILQRQLVWDIPVAVADTQWVSKQLSDRPLLVINPSSSLRLRNWRNPAASRYAQLMVYAVEKYNMEVVLTGGPSSHEAALAESILSDPVIQQKPKVLAAVDTWVGKTTLKQLTALMQRARVVVSPDTGPAHIANAVGTPVIGLYATSNPKRTGPYCSLELTVNTYPEALQQYEGLTEAEACWGKRVRDETALELITLAAITSKLDRVMNRPAA